jgi:hypothetical protein
MFIVEMADKYKSILSSIGLFSRRDLIRMNDLKVYADIIHTFDVGFETIKSKQLDDLYRKYNASFVREEEVTKALTSGVDGFLADQEFHKPVFLRGHVFQTLVLAIIERNHPGTIPNLSGDQWAALNGRVAAENVSINALSEALGDPDAHPQLLDFIKACTTRTNVQSQRLIRFAYLHQGLAST